MSGAHAPPASAMASGSSRIPGPMLEVSVARGFLARLRGLHGLSAAEPGRPRALVLWPCRAVHTLGMRVPIDVVFLGPENRILRHVPGLLPNRWAFDRRARAVVELPAGYCSDPSWSPALSTALRDSKIMT